MEKRSVENFGLTPAERRARRFEASRGGVGRLETDVGAPKLDCRAAELAHGRKCQSTDREIQRLERPETATGNSEIEERSVENIRLTPAERCIFDWYP